MQDWMLPLVSLYITRQEYCYFVFALDLSNTIALLEMIQSDVLLPKQVMNYETKRAIRANKYFLVKYFMEEYDVKIVEEFIKTAISCNRKAIVKYLTRYLSSTQTC